MYFASILPSSLTLFLTSLLWPQSQRPIATNEAGALTFQLRHIHAINDRGQNVFADSSHSTQSFSKSPPTKYPIPTKLIKTHRPSSFEAFSNARFASSPNQSAPSTLSWGKHDIIGPRVEKRQTLVQLAKMTFDSFYDGPGHKEWYTLDSYWNQSQPFGWEPDADGFRGQIFVSEDNSTVVVAIKGTSAPWFAGGDGPTKPKDKLNNNLLFSCCCARVGPTWSPVCGCYSGDNKCSTDCVERALTEDSLFYPIGTNLYNNVSYMYPHANIWLTGHSLGGSLASLLGVTFGVPVVTFEAPGDRLAARRLHLPSPPSTQHIVQVFHTADPVPVGACTGVLSSCAIGGYAIESKCHLGQVIRYDTVKRKGWSVSVRNHAIQVMIDNVLNEEWDSDDGREVPLPFAEEDCEDCLEWNFE